MYIDVSFHTRSLPSFFSPCPLSFPPLLISFVLVKNIRTLAPTSMIAWQIDVHHGDGVEEAFCYSSSVLTISFHHYAPLFFPGSGALTDQAGAGAKECIINVPLLEGCSDHTFLKTFTRTIRGNPRIICELFLPYFKILASSFGTNHSLSRIPSGAACSFAPSAVVMQCGADSLTGDPLGQFNLTVRGYTDCIEELRRALPDTPGKQSPRL